MAKLAREIWIREEAGAQRFEEPVRVSLPFAEGELPSLTGVGLLDPQQNPVPVQLEPLGRWQDGSVQWLLVEFMATLPASADCRYLLTATAAVQPSARVEATAKDGHWLVETGSCSFALDCRQLTPFLWGEAGGKRRLAGRPVTLLRGDGTRLAGRVERAELECAGALRTSLILAGSFDPSTLFRLRATFWAGKSYCRLDFTIHNPRAARHAAGMWDLGDPNSLFFSELSLDFEVPGAAEMWTLVAQAGGERLCLREEELPLSIRQESSGGERRLSPNHLAAGGRLSCTDTGYRIGCGGTDCSFGARAVPTLRCNSGVGVFLPRFWQEFPKQLAAKPGLLQVSLFPAGMPEPYELQGGEQKTTTFWIDLCAGEEDLELLRSPLAAQLPPGDFRRSGLFPDLPPGGEGEDLVDRFLASPVQLFQRREVIDEYGWRNFGEFYADHEAQYGKGEDPFISHYNNQYDVCAGLYRKGLACGDPRWGELAADLARHVLDIDIYHTAEDREEYSGGLFWHTDHFISAGLATHRTFSAVHLATRDARFYGGGPAAEHCYTSGLMLHYYLTGEPEYREAVLSLADWCYRSLAGPPLVLATLKKSLRYLSRLRRAAGTPFPRFPLSRGTGNAIVACLDAFQLSGDRSYLDRAEEMIRGSLHPQDDPELRDLREPEMAWSYTVLLAAVAKFLDRKLQLGELDEGFMLARCSLLAYADWIARHEYPYLEKPELLVIPSETWAAQELRKCVVLYQAARYGTSDRVALYLEKARLLLERARCDLGRYQTSNCTRPVALMLQNGWIATALAAGDFAPLCLAPPPTRCRGAMPRLTFFEVLRRVSQELHRALRETTVKRELAWLRSRCG